MVKNMISLVGRLKARTTKDVLSNQCPMLFKHVPAAGFSQFSHNTYDVRTHRTI